MDEILASIRRILKEDENQDEAVSSNHPEDEILVLSAEMEAKPAPIDARPEPLAAPLANPEPEPASLATPSPDTPSPGTPRNLPQNETEMDQAMDEHRRSLAGLVSETATAEITSALGPLMRGVSPERSMSIGRGGVTLEDIVREEIRPVLKAWLDAHLPGLVERVVRAEIERVIDRTKL
jgi:cell pole-organizing protein PopZ